MGHLRDKVMIKPMSALLLVSSQFILAAWAKPMENGQSVVGREGVIIDCRTQHDSYFPDPDDCRFFYHCSDWTGLERKSCGSLYFHHQKRVCDWPYIVREIRPECPDERNLPPLPKNQVVAIETTEKPIFDDGSYIRFEPNPENKFRFPTPKPRRPVKNPVVFQESDFITNTLRPTLLIKEHEPIRSSHPDVQVIQLSVPPRVPTPSRAEAPRHLSFESDQDGPFILVKKKDPNSSSSVGSTTWISTTTEAPVTVVKTLPSRDIVKSLPTPQPVPVPSFVQQQPTPAPTPAPIHKEIQNARRPLFDPASRPNILKKDRKKPISRTTTTTVSPVRTLPAHRYSPSLRPPIFTTERPKRNDLYCSGPRCFRPRKQDRETFKIKASNGDDIETIFEQVLDTEDADKFKRKSEIKKLLEAAKVETVDNSDVSDDEVVSDEDDDTKSESTTISSLKVPPSERNETYTTTPKPKVEIKSTLSPFRKADERPEFLEVIKMKAEEFKEKLQNEEALTPTTEISVEKDTSERIVISVSKEVSTSIGTSNDQDESLNQEIASTEKLETQETTTENTSSTMSTTSSLDIVSPSSSTEFIAEEIRELFKDTKDPEESLVIVKPSEFDNDLIESFGEVEDMVIVVPSSQVNDDTIDRSEELVDPITTISPEDTIEDDVNALQETRLHSTLVTTMEPFEDAEDLQVTELPTEMPTEVPPIFEVALLIAEDKPDSVEMLTSVLDVFNVTALFEHLQQKPIAQKLQQVNPSSLENLPEDQTLVQDIDHSSIDITEATPVLIEEEVPIDILEEEADETTLIESFISTTTIPSTEQPETMARSSDSDDIQVVLPADQKVSPEIISTDPTTTIATETSSLTIDETSTMSPLAFEAETSSPIDEIPTQSPTTYEPETTSSPINEIPTQSPTTPLSETELPETVKDNSTPDVTTSTSATEEPPVTVTASNTIISSSPEPPQIVSTSVIVPSTSTEATPEPSFTSRRDQIRQRFLSKSRPSKTVSILNQLKQQQADALEASRRQKSFQSFEASKNDDEIGSPSNTPPTASSSPRSVSVNRDRLTNLRKKLFNRAPPTTPSPKPENLPDESSTKFTGDPREGRRSSLFFNRSTPSETSGSDLKPTFQATSARQSVRCRVLKLSC